MGTGGDIVEEDRRSEAEQGAADEGEQGQVGAGARGPVDPEKEEGGGGWEPPQQEQQLQEPSHVAPEGLQPRDRQPGLPRHTFTGLRLKGLESVFQRTQYPDVFSARKELAFLLDVAEPRAQVSEPEHGDSAGPPV
ncbi:rhox homeobox family member 1-like [Diceros bicornis minor]|nr:rhox homeobox family member 1-like [Diceros bicornis minor]XP_058391275.1 rhox homeobox family member 1-like [Diceros bicornis minor]XP_058391276.1 rhox homeobox family member 1-like [Diceros bicornis minor]XP_058391277.1 rhox homeobox family member 1-like [Diceros bicornis minor]XP_058391278.1 rhox homeobox family member 1-like [Diceros bicornis minor]XP_058391279.1 rhox homeobox family member 1-like [Diceros bicornis minor]XP_058391280.1 rhox homeobox family member 1-like [Diceros bicorn